MTEKTNLLVLCGGQSSEHEVSVLSARSMLEYIDPDRYAVTVVGIGRDGRWVSSHDRQMLLAADSIDVDSAKGAVPVSLQDASLVPINADQRATTAIDVVFPLLHGPCGEDGTVQGLLELANVAYVGSGVLGSAMGMDKDIAKRLFKAAGLSQLAWQVESRRRWEAQPQAVITGLVEKLRWPMFVKPANAGSSVGVSKVHTEQELSIALKHAAQFDSKMVIEEDAGDCHEVECAVLGNDQPRASVVGEIIPGNEFYDYADKYVNGVSEDRIPAQISDLAASQVRKQAIVAFQTIQAAGLARVDFFVHKQSEAVYINEINTMPGFTPISMYPKLWAASGLSYADLIDELIVLALDRHRDRQRIKLTV